MPPSNVRSADTATEEETKVYAYFEDCKLTTCMQLPIQLVVILIDNSVSNGDRRVNMHPRTWGSKLMLHVLPVRRLFYIESITSLSTWVQLAGTRAITIHILPSFAGMYPPATQSQLVISDPRLWCGRASECAFDHRV